MIHPKPGLPVLHERPPLNPSTWVRFACRAFRPIVRFLRRWRQRVLDGRLSNLLTRVGRCDSRTELEQLLGQPQYALAGHLFSSTPAEGRPTTHPEQVESYAVRGCRIELWFTGGRVSSLCGFVDSSPWDLAQVNAFHEHCHASGEPDEV